MTRDEVRAKIATLSPEELRGLDDIIGDVSGFDVSNILFPPQLRFVEDGSKFKTGLCSRRGGKTVGCATSLLRSAKSRPGAMNLYITRSRRNAKRILWGTLKRLNAEHRLGGEANESDLAIRFPNESSIHLAGANDRDAIEDFRGNPIAKVVIDESQSLPAYLEDLVDEVLEPALMDYDGSLELIGTPGPVPVGYFFRACTSKQWSHHHWTVFENPWILKKSRKTPQQHLNAALARRGVTIDDPRIQREWFGRWVYDPDSLVFKFSEERNVFAELPKVRAQWQFVIGVDLGFDDADAIAVLAFNAQDPNCYIVDEWVGAKQSITGLADRLRKLVAKYSPLSTVVDTGGLGKKIADEVQSRTKIAMKAAEKTRKMEFIELVNDALTSGRLRMLAGSPFAADAMLIEWDREKEKDSKRKESGAARVISDRFHSDIADAVLYAYREALHWLHVPPKEPGPPVGSEEWAQEQADAGESRAEEKLQRRNSEEGSWLDDWN